MTYLVLGSAGLVGKYLVKHLVTSGETVLKYDYADKIEQDLRLSPQNYLHKMFQQADYVYFLAFDVGGYKYLTENQSNFSYIQNNTLIMLNVFELLKYYQKPFVFTSTQLVNQPDSAYGALKTVGEHYTKSLDGRIVRLWNVYGFESDDIRGHVTHDFIKSALTKREIKLISNGQEEKQLLHAIDCAKALVTVQKHHKNIPQDASLHISSFIWTKIIDVAHLIASKIPDVKITPGPINVSIANNQPDPYILDLWMPEISLNDGVETLIEEYYNTMGIQKI